MQTYDNKRKTIKKWHTISEYIDIETGEIIPKWKFEKNYYKIKSNISYEFEKEIGIKKYTHECRAIRQYELKL